MNKDLAMVLVKKKVMKKLNHHSAQINIVTLSSKESEGSHNMISAITITHTSKPILLFGMILVLYTFYN